MVAVRAQGAGGQNVNKVSNAVHLRFVVRASSLPEQVKQRLLELPDHVQALPGHLGGPLCGSAAMSEAPASTIGFEPRFNPLFAVEREAELVERLTGALKPQPPNFRRIANCDQAAICRGVIFQTSARAWPLWISSSTARAISFLPW